MSHTNILLAGIWIVVMLIYLLGDVLRIFAGDFTPGQMNGQPITQSALMIMAVLMLFPILMIFTSLVAPQNINRWANIIIALVFIVLNLTSLPTYPDHYDKFLLLVSMVFNGITIWTAWNWNS